MEYGLEHIDHLQVTDIDEDLVKLANSLFNSEEVVDMITFYMVFEF